MEMAAIQRIDIVTTTNGVTQATAALDALGRAHQGVTVASETSERATLSLERRVESISRKFDLQYRAEQELAKVERDLNAARGQGLIGLDRQNQLMDLARQKALGMAAANSNAIGTVNQFGAAVKSSSGQVGGIAAQFQDVAVQLAGGQSPFLIALQQGTQLSGQLEQTGGGVKSLGAAFLSLVSPMSLATIGGIAAFGLLTQYLTSAGAKVETLDDRLETHAGVIKQIRDAYGEATLGLETFARESNRVLEVQLRAATTKLRADLASLASDLANSATKVQPQISMEFGLPTDLAPIVAEATTKYQAFNDALVTLRNNAAAGEPQIRQFRDAVASIGAASEDPKVRRLADELLSLSAEAFKAETAVNASARAIGTLNGQAAAGIGDIAAYGKALSALSQIGLPNLTDRQKALQSYTEAVSKAGGFEERTAAARAYESAIKRVGEREAEEAAKAAARGGGRSSAAKESISSYETLIQRTKDRIEELQLEAQYADKTAGAVVKLKLAHDLERAAKKSGVEVTAEMRAEWDRYGDSMAAAVKRNEDAKRSQDLLKSSFESSAGAFKSFAETLITGTGGLDAALKGLGKTVLSNSLDALISGKGPLAGITGLASTSKDGQGGILGMLAGLPKAVQTGAQKGAEAGSVDGVTYGLGTFANSNTGSLLGGIDSKALAGGLTAIAGLAGAYGVGASAGSMGQAIGGGAISGGMAGLSLAGTGIGASLGGAAVLGPLGLIAGAGLAPIGKPSKTGKEIRRERMQRLHR